MSTDTRDRVVTTTNEDTSSIRSRASLVACVGPKPASFHEEGTVHSKDTPSAAVRAYFEKKSYSCIKSPTAQLFWPKNLEKKKLKDKR